MAAQDKKSVIKDLIELGKSKGKLTTKEITDALEELDFDVEKVDKLYDTLEGLNIEIIEDLEPDIDLDLSTIPVSVASEEEEAPPADGVNIDDPVKVYLKEIGRRSNWHSGWHRGMITRKNACQRRICGWSSVLPNAMWDGECSFWI